MMNPVVWLISQILGFYSFIVIVWIIMSWLIGFNVINRHNRFVQSVNYVLTRLVEPVLRPIRKIVPPVGGIDFSPIILFLLINFIQYTLAYYFYR